LETRRASPEFSHRDKCGLFLHYGRQDLRIIVALSATSDVIEEISIRQNQDDSTDIVSAQRWASRKAYEEYFKWRTEDGYTAKFEQMLENPLVIRFFDEIPMD
jgi:hypothetical protein